KPFTDRVSFPISSLRRNCSRCFETHTTMKPIHIAILFYIHCVSLTTEIPASTTEVPTLDKEKLRKQIRENIPELCELYALEMSGQNIELDNEMRRLKPHLKDLMYDRSTLDEFMQAIEASNCTLFLSVFRPLAEAVKTRIAMVKTVAGREHINQALIILKNIIIEHSSNKPRNKSYLSTDRVAFSNLHDSFFALPQYVQVDIKRAFHNVFTVIKKADITLEKIIRYLESLEEYEQRKNAKIERTTEPSFFRNVPYFMTIANLSSFAFLKGEHNLY
ncbi:hypothetical protein PFISCL1PPCAC_8523, partial [Pristionchus fissidentatus]